MSQLEPEEERRMNQLETKEELTQDEMLELADLRYRSLGGPSCT